MSVVLSGCMGLALLACLNPFSADDLFAQKADKVQVTGSEKADRLEAIAMELLAEGETELWAEAAQVLEKAAHMRPETDMARVSNLKTAGNLYYWAGAPEQARVLFEEAAATASNLGKPAVAAHIYVDAAVIFAELKMGRHTIAAARQAELLAASPVLSAEERLAIQSRLDRLGAPRRLGEIM